jgi:aspartyl-tRNA(Asn)/glutamyl-tRNA(Gln) amidotransferase subunit A
MSGHVLVLYLGQVVASCARDELYRQPIPAHDTATFPYESEVSSVPELPPTLPLTIAEAAAWLRSGRITSVALTEAQLARAHATQETLAAFITIMDEAALAGARQADADFAAGIDKGPLQGIPLGIKDIIATRDAPSTANSRVLDPAWGQRDDATVVKKLRGAGAVILGKLGLHEFALGWPDPDTGFRIPKNPWDLTRTPGGSSSGTGAAISGGVILGGLGTCTGGSVRGPASYCGISGIKQTFGRVSKEGCVPLGYSLDHIGPMARSARDCAIMLQVMAGYDPLDLCSVDTPVPDMLGLMDGSLAGVRIGVLRDYFFTAPNLDPEVKAGVEAALVAMEAAGATLVEVSIPHAEEARLAQRITMIGEAYAYHEPDLKSKAALYGKYTRQAFQVGAFLTAADYVQAQRLRPLIRRECADAFGSRPGEGVDVLVTPTMPTTALSFAGYDPDATMRAHSFTPIWNLTGLPAISIPCGFSSEGLPIGMQVVGRPMDEPTVFKIADAYQHLTKWHLTLPPIAQQLAKEVRPA